MLIKSYEGVGGEGGGGMESAPKWQTICLFHYISYKKYLLG